MTMDPSPSDIRNLSFEEAQSFFAGIGEKSFRAGQLFDWIYKKNAASFDQMTNFSAALRSRLKEHFTFQQAHNIEEHCSEDGTRKVLFELADAQRIETVLIPARGRATVCVSTQAGCKFGCRFCASGIGGWKRNLETAEILDQILYMKKTQLEPPLTHIVFMGVGEPLDNYDNLLKAIRTINAEKGINIGARRITVSTCGVIPKIEKLAQEGIQLELAISLHGYDNESRNVLMPVNRKYPFDDLMACCRRYIGSTNRQITFEYILIKEVTCSQKALKALKKAFKGLICKMNLIPYNPVSEFDHQTPSRAEIYGFVDQLKDTGIHATVRMPRGRDVSAACGQLRHGTKNPIK